LFYFRCCCFSPVDSLCRFFPPPPTYEFIFSEETKKYKVVFSSEVDLFHCFPEFDIENDLIVDMLTTKNGTHLPVFFYRHPEATQTILFSHGNATDGGIMSSLFLMMIKHLKVNILAYDYTGYGTSMHFGVRPTEKQTYQDILTTYDWALNNKFFTDPTKQLILYGQSVGSGPSVYFATKKDTAGLILHSPIMSGLRVITDSRLLSCFDIYPNIDRIPDVRCPVFIIHGDADIEVPVVHGGSLQKAGKHTFSLSSLFHCLSLDYDCFLFFLSQFLKSSSIPRGG
jgi:pimeloyl-ACP methyl ester carboxylesterase